MGVILLLISFSEIILPSGIRVSKGNGDKHYEIAIGVECKFGTVLYPGWNKHLRRSGNNYFVMTVDSLEVLERFVHDVSVESLFYYENDIPDLNLMRLAMNSVGWENSPIVNITVGLSGNIDDKHVLSLLKKIPDSVISRSESYINILPFGGKYVYIGDRNFIANVSPPPYDRDFIVFITLLDILKRRKVKVNFSPETAPSLFFMYPDFKRLNLVLKLPEKKETKKAVYDVKKWLKRRLTRRARLTVMLSSMGITENDIERWIEELPHIENKEYRRVWERYFIRGFISEVSSENCSLLIKKFPEAEVIR